MAYLSPVSWCLSLERYRYINPFGEVPVWKKLQITNMSYFVDNTFCSDMYNEPIHMVGPTNKS
jgi:hypothetical protein